MKEGDEGNEDCQGDPAQLTAACEDSRLHRTALAWPCHLGSNVWQVARNLQLPHQDCSCLMFSGLCASNYWASSLTRVTSVKLLLLDKIFMVTSTTFLNN